MEATSLNGANIIRKPTEVYYLKMHQQPQIIPSPDSNISFVTLKSPVEPAHYLKYYRGVGFELQWLDRLVMPEEELRGKINAPGVHIYLMKVGREEAGFVELVEEGAWVELNYFGLFPHFVGKGLGKYFLNWSIHKAWSFGPQWVQVNTCALDHANALATYQKGGFELYKTTVENRRVLIS